MTCLTRVNHAYASNLSHLQELLQNFTWIDSSDNNDDGDKYGNVYLTCKQAWRGKIKFHTQNFTVSEQI